MLAAVDFKDCESHGKLSKGEGGKDKRKKTGIRRGWYMRFK